MSFRTAVILAWFAAAANAADLFIGHGVTIAAAPASLSIKLTSAGEFLSGMQFDLEYDPSLDVGVEAGPAALQAGKGLQSVMLQPGKQRVLIVGFNANSIADGAVAVLHVRAPGDTVRLRRYPIHLSGVTGANQCAESIPMVAKDGSLSVEQKGIVR